MKRPRVIAAILVAALALPSCLRSTGSNDADYTKIRSIHGVPLAPNITCEFPGCTIYNVAPYVLTRSRYGIGCLGNVPPGTRPHQRLPPQSYAVADIGKPGFPVLGPSEAKMVHSIQRYVHSKTLRLAWLGSREPGVKGEFIVFDATDGPCSAGAYGYLVLNGDCNEYYEPGESPYGTHPGPGGCAETEHRPWMTTEWPRGPRRPIRLPPALR